MMVSLYLTICFIWNVLGLHTLSHMAQFIQIQLDKVKQECNYHKIRYSKGCQVSGIPNQLYHLPESKGYISHSSKPDVTNALAQRNYEAELSEVMSRTNKELEEYFHYIISS